MPVDVRAVPPLSPADAEPLRAEVAPLQLLHDVVAWVARRTPDARIAEVVIQDEFTHDVVVRLEPRRWMVFDAT